MQMVKVGSFADYVDYLEVHPEEFALLFNTILINVTSFFRDLDRLGVSGARCPPSDHQERRAQRDDPGLERGHGLGRRSLLARDPPRRGTGHRGLPIAREDLRDRRGRGGTESGPPGKLRHQGGRGDAARAAGPLLRTGGRAVRLSQGAAKVGHLRASRPRAGRPDLAAVPPCLSQHPHVLQQRDAGARAEPFPLRAERERLPLPGKGGDAAHPFEPLSPRRSEAPRLHAGSEQQSSRPCPRASSRARRHSNT